MDSSGRLKYRVCNIYELPGYLSCEIRKNVCGSYVTFKESEKKFWEVESTLSKLLILLSFFEDAS